MPRGQVRYDWPVLRAAYVEGCEIDGTRVETPSLRQVAEKYGVKHERLRKVSSTQNWTDQRHMYLSKVEQMRREKRAENMAARGAEFDANVLEVSETLINLSRRELNRIITEARQNQKSSVSLTALRDLSIILERSQKTGRLALGDTTEETGIRAPSGQFFVVGGGSMGGDDGGD